MHVLRCVRADMVRAIWCVTMLSLTGGCRYGVDPSFPALIIEDARGEFGEDIGDGMQVGDPRVRCRGQAGAPRVGVSQPAGYVSERSNGCLIPPLQYLLLALDHNSNSGRGNTRGNAL